MKEILKKAFTLIELLVVIAIIGILSGLIVVTMNGVTQKANIAKSQVFSNSLRNALMLNLVSEWKFDGTTSADSSATDSDVLDLWGGNNGSVGSHQPTVKTGTSCIRGSCLFFNGTSGYVSVADSNTLDMGTSDLSIEFWIKTSQASVGGILYKAYQPGYSIIMGDVGAGRLKLELGDSVGYSTVASSGAINNNEWRHVVVAIDRDTSTRWYIDGISETPSTSTNSRTGTLANASALTLGAYGAAYFSGLIDDIRIYNAAVPVSLIKENYYSGLNNLFLKGEVTKEEYLSRIKEYASID